MFLNKHRYPKIAIDSKNILAKRLSDKNLSFKEALNLINDVLKNHHKYWHDVISASKPDEDKYVRSAKATPLGRLLKLIDRKIIKPHDHLLPSFIFGGVSGKNHIKAAYYLLGQQRKRTKLSLDIKRFFEQNKRKRVFNFFHYRCKCGIRGANLLADICCVPMGKKGRVVNEKTLARGFATSTRLAVWCNLDLFFRIYWKAKERLKNKNVKVAIFIDDIGITASRLEDGEMDLLCSEIEVIFQKFNVPLNEKTEIKTYLDKNNEYLGLNFGRNKLSPGVETISRQNIVRQKLKNDKISNNEKKKLINKKRSYAAYHRAVRQVKN